MPSQRPPTNVARIAVLVATIELSAGLGVHVLASRFAGALPVSVRPVVSATLSAGGIVLFLLVRYPTPVWLRSLALVIAAAPLSFQAYQVGAAGVWPLAAVQGGLAGLLVALAVNRRLAESDDGPDPAVIVICAAEAGSSLAMFITPGALSAVASAALSPFLPLIGIFGLVGAVALAIPSLPGKWFQPRFSRRLLGSALPLILAVDASLNGDSLRLVIGLTWVTFLLYGRGTWLNRQVRGYPEGQARQAEDGLLTSLELTLEVWSWLLALAVVVWTVIQSAHDGGPTIGAEELFVLALVGYNLLVHWLLRGWGRPEKRLPWHLAFLTVAIGLLEVAAHDEGMAHVFGALLVILPGLGTLACGSKMGWLLLALGGSFVGLSEVRSWLVDGRQVTAALAEGALEMLVLGLGAGVSMRSASQQRSLLGKVAARTADLARAEETLRQSEEKFRNAFSHAAIGKALVAPREGRFLAVNQALCRMLGYSEEELLALDCAALIHPADAETGRKLDAQVLSGQIPYYNGERRYLDKLGRVVWTQVTVSPTLDPGGHPFSFVTEVQDITERKRVETQLTYLADHDPLTGLLNRRRLREDLERELAAVPRRGGQGAVIFLDLDRFKEVNDTRGHSVGDQLLIAVAGALRARLRETDALARLGGDEFAILIPGARLSQAQSIARHILKVVAEQALVIEKRKVGVTASLGVALYPQDGATPEELLSRADIALFQAKASRNCYAFYDAGSDRESAVVAEQQWTDSIREALKNGRLTLHAQPIMNIRDGRVGHYELLLRMVDEAGRIIPPAAFLGVAERSGLIGEIDRWVIGEGLRALRQLDLMGCRDCNLEVNLSARALTDPAFSAFIAGEVARAGVDVSRMIVEITETAAIANITEARRFVMDMKELGLRFALDDFGSGHSSFAHLKNLPVDFLKIDGAFVKDITRNAVDRHLVSGMVGMARGLGITTVAEYVGDAEALDLLKKLGVDYAQGFHIGPPKEWHSVLEELGGLERQVPATGA